MPRYLKILIVAVMFSFIWGTWWGFLKNNKNVHKMFNKGSIRLLAKKDFFPADWIKSIEKSENIEIHLTEKDSDGDLLREMISHFSEYDVMQFSSFMARSFIFSNIFQKLDQERIPRMKNISVDFIHLDYDSANDFVLPLTWGLSGFLIHSKKLSLTDETLKELIGVQSKLAVINSPVEIFNLALKLKPILKTWVETGQLNELANLAKELRSTLTPVPSDYREKIYAGDFSSVQMYSGQAARWVGGESQYRFMLPQDRGVLWLALLGVSRAAKNPTAANDFIQMALKEKHSESLVKKTEQATVLQTLNSSDLLLMQKAEFLRKVPLSRVELYIDHEALDPVWSQVYKKEWN